MNITKTNKDGQITLKLDGWLDTSSSPELGKAIDEIDAANDIILDFEGVEYIASSGLRQLVASHRRAKDLNAGLSIINVCGEVMNIFRLTGLDKKMNITENQ